MTKEILKKSKYNNIITERQDNNKHYVKSSTKSMNNFYKIKLNLNKQKGFIKKTLQKKIELTKERVKNKNSKLIKTNFKKIYSKSKFNISEYLLSFINRIKTETDISNRNIKEKENKKLLFHYDKKYKNKSKSKNKSTQERLLTSISSSKEKVKKKFSQQIRKLISKQTKSNLKINHRKLSSNIYPSIRKNSNNISYNKYHELFEKNSKNNYSSINNNYNILLTSNRKNDESIDYDNNIFSKQRKAFLKVNSYGKNHLINSPLNTLNVQTNRNNNIKNKKLFNLKKKAYSNKQKVNSNNLNKINNNKSENNNYYVHKKYTKKSCDLNLEKQNKCKKNILSKIYNTNIINNYTSKFQNKSKSIDSHKRYYSNNTICISKKLQKTNTNELIKLPIQERKTERDKYNKIFKKIISIKIPNLKKRKDSRIIKGNIIKNENNIPLSIKINTSNFLSKFKGK